MTCACVYDAHPAVWCFRFNLPHDDDDNQCKGFKGLGRGGKRYHVMAPTLDANSNPWDWSACSAKLMTEFIE